MTFDGRDATPSGSEQDAREWLVDSLHRDWLDISRRISHGEDERTELTRGVDLKQIGAALRAFANSSGGVLVLGVEDSGLGVHWIEVAAQRGYEPMRHRGRVYVRRGRASVEPSPSQLQELLNRFGYVFTEEQIVASAGLRHIDTARFDEFMGRLGIETRVRRV